ncbi:nitrogen fixation protein FixH [Brevundimonas denitrificans]|uniref:Nitrogen fixation protein FixH n=1 Tax=Brevundimonas denitrificans TaxID=1443434 RepID=A0ABQ6BHI0_9CAUL|nr:FixH family protein [Brevundimonas denitrificans]GLS01500.1 nitrogen fixation protein FixH [Brevundimonas denitrificans]
MTPAPSAPPRVPFTVKGWHVAAGVVAFFALVIGVDAAFLTLAYRTHPGQVAPRPYETGLIYNAELERQRAQEALGWRAAVEARPDGVTVLLQDRNGQPLSGLRVTATLLRPATEQGRTVLTLTEAAPGRYAGDRAGLSGVWDTRVDAAGGGHSFVAERRLTWP